MGKGGSAPTPPNPKQVAGDQTSTNIGTAIASNHMRMMNQHTPWGSIVFNQVGGAPSGGGGVRRRRSAPMPKRPDILDQSFAGWMAKQNRGNRGYSQGGSWDPGSDRQQNLRVRFENERDIAREKFLKKKNRWEDRNSDGQLTAGPGDGNRRGMRGGGSSGDMIWNDPTTGKSYRIPRYESRMTLNPKLQAALDNQFRAGRALSRQIAKQSKKRLRAPNLKETYNIETRDRVEQALMDRMNPYIDRDRDRLDTRLINQGIMPGAAQRDARVDEFNRGVNDARLGAIINAGNEARADAGFTNNARLAEFQARQQALNDPINRLSAILGAGQVAAPPVQQIAPEGIPTVDYAGLVNTNFNQQMDVYKQQQAMQQQILGGLFGLGGNLIKAMPFGGA